MSRQDRDLWGRVANVDGRNMQGSTGCMEFRAGHMQDSRQFERRILAIEPPVWVCACGTNLMAAFLPAKCPNCGFVQRKVLTHFDKRNTSISCDRK